MPTPLLLAAFLFLIPGETPLPGPDVDLPDGLDTCIAAAEGCAIKAETSTQHDMCFKDFLVCIDPFPEAELPSCRMDYAWCRLDEHADQPDINWKHCLLVYDQCPE